MFSSKKYYFLAGLPRSGNTAIASILNQNSKIQVSANSFVSTIFCHILDQSENIAYKNFPDEKSIRDCASGIFNSYYKSWKGKIIIDRSNWGTPGNLRILEQYCPNEIKIICPVRSVNEILASFIVKYKESGRIDIKNKFEVEKVCENLMENDGIITRSVWSVNNLSKKEYKNKVHFIHYDDFCDNPKKEIDLIYDFLNIKKFKHNFTNIKEYKVNGISYNDDILGCKLHDVKTNVSKTEHEISDILPQSIIKRYESVTFEHLKN